MIVPKASRIVNGRPTLFLNIKSAIYDDCINILEAIVTSDDKRINMLRDMLITPKLPQWDPSQTDAATKQ